MKVDIESVIQNSNQTQMANLLRLTDIMIHADQLDDMLDQSLPLLPSIIPADCFMIVANQGKDVYQLGVTDDEMERFNYLITESDSKVWKNIIHGKKLQTNRFVYKDPEWERTKDYRYLLQPSNRYHFAISPVVVQDQVGATVHFVRGKKHPYTSAEINRLRALVNYLSFGMRTFTHIPEHKVQLTKREHEVLQLMAMGLKIAAISHELGISYYTVKDHIKNIYRKLDVSSRSQAIVKAVKYGLLKI